MDEQELRRRIAAGAWAENNGKVLRTINILMGKDIKLRSLQYALSDLTDADLAKSLYYLQEAGYLHARKIYGKAAADVADADYDDTEVRLTAEGMRLLEGYASDPAVKV